MKRVVISITERCMLSCRHCYNQSKKSNTTADYVDESFIIRLLELGVKQLVLSGGEPLLEWGLLCQIMEIIKKRISVVITTNGILLDENKIEILKKLGVSSIQVSLDGVSASTHELLRGKGTYEHTYNMVKNHPEIIVPMYTIHALNYKEVGAFIRQQIINNHKKIGFERYISVSTDRKNNILKLSREQLFHAYDEICEFNEIEFHINDPIFNVYMLLKHNVPDDIIKTFFESGCQALDNNIYIDAKGDVFSCVFSKEKLFNIHYADISLCNNHERTICNDCIMCQFFNVCKGCRAAAFYYLGDWKGLDPLCPLN